MPAGQGQPGVQGQPTQRAVGGRFYLCAHVGGLYLRGLRDRCLRKADRWLESQHLSHGELRPGCSGTGDPCMQAKR
jgi:hypothetical protein